MTWKYGGRRRGYHHGNLREALIQSALSLIADKGPAGFTFAEAARCAGVSPAAPYRHFRDRDELMADVARLGFERFTEVLEQAWNAGKPSPMEALQNLGRAYLNFARTEPAYYAAMFETHLPRDAAPGLEQAADRAFNVLLNAMKQLCAEAPEAARPPALMVALHIWSMSHGIASLFAHGSSAARLPMSADDLLEAGVLIYLRGLGIGTPSSAKS